MNTLQRILEYWPMTPPLTGPQPIEIPNVGRDDLAKLFGHLQFTRILEVGVERGKFTQVLCEGAPNARVTVIDPWEHYTGYRDHVSQAKLEGFYAETVQRLQPYNVEVIRGYSEHVVHDIPDDTFDAVYIDANHDLLHVVTDLTLWTPKVKRGGIISGHDFRQPKNVEARHHVVEAVRAFTQSYRIEPWFVLGRRAVLPNETRDRNRSFMWVRQ